jgi:hypothetical protein
MQVTLPINWGASYLAHPWELAYGSVNGLFVIERAPEVGDVASAKIHRFLDRPEVTAACCVPVNIADFEKASAAAPDPGRYRSERQRHRVYLNGANGDFSILVEQQCRPVVGRQDLLPRFRVWVK